MTATAISAMLTHMQPVFFEYVRLGFLIYPGCFENLRLGFLIMHAPYSVVTYRSPLIIKIDSIAGFSTRAKYF